MENKKLIGVLTLLIPEVIKEIISNDKIDEKSAIENFYNSNIYSLLEDDKTKLWHLSPKALYSLYHEEKETGKITFPEED